MYRLSPVRIRIDTYIIVVTFSSVFGGSRGLALSHTLRRLVRFVVSI